MSTKKQNKMKSDTGFVDYCLDLLTPCGATHARAMFGGYGLYRERLIFGLIADNRLYFKTDDQNRPDFEKYDTEPFTYKKNGKTYKMSYYEVPVDVLENEAVLQKFFRGACAATRRSKIQ